LAWQVLIWERLAMASILMHALILGKTQPINAVPLLRPFPFVRGKVNMFRRVSLTHSWSEEILLFC
jgi:hypothetical protein